MNCILIGCCTGNGILLLLKKIGKVCSKLGRGVGFMDVNVILFHSMMALIIILLFNACFSIHLLTCNRKLI